MYDSSQAEVAFDDDGGAGLYSIVNLTDLPAGDYFIKIDDFNNDQEIPSYDLTANFTYKQPDLAIVSFFHLPSPFIQGQDLEGGVIVENIGNAPSQSTDVDVYLSTSQTIVPNQTSDILGPLWSPALSAGEPFDPPGGEPIGAVTLEQGRYWLGACIQPPLDEANLANNCTTPEEVEVHHPAADIYELDDFPEKAKTNRHSDSQVRSIKPATDSDWATFTLRKPSRVIIETTGSYPDDTVMWLYDSAINQIAVNDDWNRPDSLFSRLEQPQLHPGQYFIEIQSFLQGTEIDAYNLRLVIDPENAPVLAPLLLLLD